MADDTLEFDDSQRWDDFFQSLLEILYQYEYDSNSSQHYIRENVLGRLEYVTVALQQLLPLVVNDRECFVFLQQLSTNFRLLALEWRRGVSQQRSTQCTNLAIYSLSSPPELTLQADHG